MDTKKIIKIAILICFILLFILVMVIISLLLNANEEKQQIEIKAEQKKQDVTNDVYDTTTFYVTIKDVLEAYECELYKEVTDPTEMLYVGFPKDLYEKNGKSNKEYFENLMIACAKRLVKDRFFLYDEDRNIQIIVQYDFFNKVISYTINGISDYFDNIKPDKYIEMENIETPKIVSIEKKYNILYELLEKDMYLINSLGEPEGDDEFGYTYYRNGTIKAYIRAGRIINIVFREGFEEEVYYNISVGTPLRDVVNIVDDEPVFGSVDAGFVAYRTPEVYVFFYENEISVYGYSYYEHTEFEKYLEEYLAYKDLETFKNNLLALWQTYDKLEYNKDEKNLYLTYPYAGVIIDIKENNPKGIQLYSNYCFTDKTKKMVAENYITLFSREDAILNRENYRRTNEN